MKVTFIGLGIMGSRMAANLLKNNVDLTVYNRSKEPVQKLVAKGAKTADSFAGAVKDADIVFTMLSTPEVVQQVMLEGDSGALSAMKQNAIWVDSSTVNPSFSKHCKEEAQRHRIRFIDGPVSGSKPQAENAELIFLAGGDEKDFNDVKGLMEYMGKKIHHMGDTGKGTSMKMLVNVMLAESMAIFAEAVAFGEKMGISRDFLLDVLPEMPVSAPLTKAKSAFIRNDNYEPQFPMEWMHKDLHLAGITAYESKYPLYLASLTKDLYAQALKNGMKGDDFSAIYKSLKGLK